MDKQRLKETWGRYVDTDKLVDDVMTLLQTYHHRCSEHGVCTMLNTYFINKEPLIKMFFKSGNYAGNLRIVMTKEFERDNNLNDVRHFCDEFIGSVGAEDALIRTTDDSGKSFQDYLCTGVMSLKASDLQNPDFASRFQHNAEALGAFDRRGRFKSSVEKYLQFTKAIRTFRSTTASSISVDMSDNISSVVPEVKCAAGMKTSRAFNRVCDSFGITQLPKYNKLFAEYADMVSGLKRTLDYVISVNPYDYLTMSFGKNWASCQTIDQTNQRNMPNSYSGMYCAGTMSYMLDKASIVTYVVDHGADVQECGKIYRIMFHYENNALIQGRVYPQGNDGSTDLYHTFRELMQAEMAVMLGLENNSWVIKQGSSACDRISESTGRHYRDYTHFSDCNVCYPKERSGSVGIVHIGHDGICTYCGNEHPYQDRLAHKIC